MPPAASNALAILRDRHAMRVLRLLAARGPLRFRAVQDELGLNPAQVDRTLKRLQKGLYVLGETIPTKGQRVFLRYRIGKRGEAVLSVVGAMVREARRKRAILGDESVEEIEALMA